MTDIAEIVALTVEEKNKRLQESNPIYVQINLRCLDPGIISLITGPMFSGKSTELMQEYRRMFHAKKNVLSFKHESDNRYGDGICSHDKDSIASVSVPNSKALGNVYIQHEARKHVNSLFLDEVNFFDAGIIPTIAMISNHGTDVYMAGLLKTSSDKYFPFYEKTEDGLSVPTGKTMGDLLEIVEQITTKHAYCKECGKPAYYTQKLVSTGSTVTVGGENAYAAMCKRHFTPIE